jgi:hypothetical protein
MTGNPLGHTSGPSSLQSRPPAPQSHRGEQACLVSKPSWPWQSSIEMTIRAARHYDYRNLDQELSMHEQNSCNEGRDEHFLAGCQV